ncbi:MAG: zinc ABC transporter substrate-binding protein [Epsilonproteobacteria bacterium]|nr:MAG: zinc ABC transporter substrate-binding protein [Campylobacterota bacterium]
MKKILLISILSTTYIFSNINVVVSILPQHTFVKAIGGDKVDIALMVKPGNSPHTYEPKPSQMIEIAKADLYFAIDVEFENVWLPKFKNLNSNMQVIDLADNIIKIQIQKSHADIAHHDTQDHEGDDPHIWTAPTNVKIIAQNIYEALVKNDLKNSAYYKRNLEIFLASIAKTDKQISQILSTLPVSRRFMVFHPSWGYFAKDYNLEQVPVEIEGKAPKPKELIHLLKEAKEEKVNAIFTQPEFPDTVAKIIAKELQIPVVKVSPLSSNWSQTLLKIANTIAGNN